MISDKSTAARQTQGEHPGQVKFEPRATKSKSQRSNPPNIAQERHLKKLNLTKIIAYPYLNATVYIDRLGKYIHKSVL